MKTEYTLLIKNGMVVTSKGYRLLDVAVSGEKIEALWKSLSDGVLDVVASDHAPKGQKPDEDFFNAAYGSAQAETLLPLTYNGGVNTGRITLSR